MSDITLAARPSRPVAAWAGLVLSTLATLFLLADAATGLFAPQLLGKTSEEAGFRPDSVGQIGVLILVCAILYAVPRTAVLGAILVTGFCGGAICAHFRLGEIGSPPQLVSLLLGVAVWGGLYLRDARLRALLPLRAPEGGEPLDRPR